MLLSIDNWNRARHGPRVQAKAISFISQRMELLDTYYNEGDGNMYLQPILRDCREQATPDVAENTLRRWWYIYEEWGDLPHHVCIMKKDIEKRMNVSKKSKISDAELLVFGFYFADKLLLQV